MTAPILFLFMGRLVRPPVNASLQACILCEPEHRMQERATTLILANCKEANVFCPNWSRISVLFAGLLVYD